MEEKKDSAFKEFGKKLLNVTLEVSPYILCGQIFRKVFYKRNETDPCLKFKRELFPNLIAEKCVFPTSNRVDLTGYFYHYDKFDDKNVIVFAHGLGNGHTRYLDVINYLAKAGFLVFAFDFTSYDESEGKGIYSFPQGVIDLENAIKYVSTRSKYRKRKIFLLGHSWGAYSVSVVLNVYPKVEKVVALSGFNKSEDIVKAHAEEWAGKDAPTVSPYIIFYERLHYKKYADFTAIDGFKKTKAEILIIHSKDDNVVPITSGLELYKEELKDNPRLQYLKYKDKGHGTIYYSKEGQDYFNNLQQQYKNAIKQSNIVSLDAKDDFFDKLIDKSKYLDMLDYDLLNKIITFLRS